MGWGSGCRGEREGFKGSRGGCGQTQKGRTRGCRGAYIPIAKPFSSEILGEVHAGGREFGYTPSLALGYSVDQETPFYGQILIPLMRNNCILFFNVAWTRRAHCRLLHGPARGTLLGKRQLLE